MSKLKNSFISFLIGRPLVCLIIPFLLTLLFSIGLLRFKSNYTPRIWFEKNSPDIVQLDNFEKMFGGEQFVSIGIYLPKEELTQEHLKKFADITQKLWLLPDIIRVETISNYNDIRGEEDEIIVEPLSDNFQNKEQFLEKVKAMETIKNIFISPSYDYYIFNAYLKPYFEDNPNFSKVVDATKKYVEELRSSGFKVFLLGPAAVTNAFRKVTASDLEKMIPLMFLVTLLLLWFQFRNLATVVVSIGLIALTIGVSMGFLSSVGIVYNGIAGALPGILMAICLADSIHLFTTFYQQKQLGKTTKESLKYSLERNFLPTILTSLTTAISFITIAQTDLVPVQGLGYVASFGAIMAWWYTYFLFAGAIGVKPDWFDSAKVIKSTPFLNGVKYMKFINKFKNTIILFFGLLFLLSLFISRHIEVNSDPVLYFSEGMDIKKSYDFSKTKMDGLKGINIVVDSGEVDGAKDPLFLKQVDSFIEEIKKDPEIVQVRSILTTLKEINGVLKPELVEKQLPDSKKAVAEQLFLYQISLPSGAGIENLMTIDYSKILLRVSWTLESVNEGLEKAKEIEKKAREKFSLNAYVGGNFPIYSKVNNLVVQSFLKSMSMTILIVSLILLVVFKDLLISFLSMLPNILPLVIGTMVMALSGIFLDIGTSIVAAICLGIAVDDTIHFVSSYLRNKKEGLEHLDALEKTFNGTGKALILTTVILVFGFGVFVFADFLPNRYFGMLCAIVLSFALFTDLVLLPAVLIKWDRRSLKKDFP